MITNFKIFESNIQFDNLSYWIIYGGKYTAIDVLTLLIKQINKTKTYDLNVKLVSGLQTIIIALKGYISSNRYQKSNATILRYSDKNGFEFSTYNSKNEDDKSRIESEYRRWNFKGNLQKVNGELVLDTLEVDTNKYNL